MKEGADRAGKRLGSCKKYVRWPPVCLDFGGKTSPTYSRKRPTTRKGGAHRSIANAAKHQRSAEAAPRPRRKGARRKRIKEEGKGLTGQGAPGHGRKLEAKLAKARRDGDAREVEKYARWWSLQGERIEEGLCRSCGRSDWEDEANQHVEETRSTARHETAVEKSEKEKDQAKAEGARPGHGTR